MNPILQKVTDQVTAKVSPELKNTFQRIVAAGEKVMYSPESHKLMLQQMTQGTPEQAVGEGIAKLLVILLHESKNTLNMKAAIPAMTVLMCDALDFMEQAGKVKVTNELVDETTKEMTSSILQILKIDPQNIQTQLAQRIGA